MHHQSHHAHPKNQLPLFLEKMNHEQLPKLIQVLFAHYYGQIVSGHSGLIFEKDIDPLPLGDIPKKEDLDPYEEKGCALLKNTVMIKLNGGLGTGMGLTSTKSLLNVVRGKTFLEIILQQAAAKHLTLVLMNSYNTHQETVRALNRIQPDPMPIVFCQHKFPKVLQTDLSPARWPADPELEWNPAGHGDLYMALYTSGVLDSLMDAGIQYAFVSNSDNLGATVDPALLGYFAAKNLTFMMEVAKRTESDQKGGHLARNLEGGWILREIAQCPETDIIAFTDIHRHQNFNTNNIWIRLDALKRLLTNHKFMRLPLIANPKPLDPREEDSPKVFQIETAMGHAMSLFQNVNAVRVPRTRFLPVKKSSDLLIARSDLFTLSDDGELKPRSHQMEKLPSIHLDPKYYKHLDAFNKRLSDIPSLKGCHSLKVKGDVKFENDVILERDVTIFNTLPYQAVIPKGSVLTGERHFADGRTKSP